MALDRTRLDDLEKMKCRYYHLCKYCWFWRVAFTEGNLCLCIPFHHKLSLNFPRPWQVCLSLKLFPWSRESYGVTPAHHAACRGSLGALELQSSFKSLICKPFQRWPFRDDEFSCKAFILDYLSRKSDCPPLLSHVILFCQGNRCLWRWSVIGASIDLVGTESNLGGNSADRQFITE